MCEIDPMTLEKYSDIAERSRLEQERNENNRKKVFFKKNKGVSKVPENNEKLTKFFGINNNVD